jgi:Na+-transporting methylmalonyl-CoA/oxaloacetate decarboxylase gamma subunit
MTSGSAPGAALICIGGVYSSLDAPYNTSRSIRRLGFAAGFAFIALALVFLAAVTLASPTASASVPQTGAVTQADATASAAAAPGGPAPVASAPANVPGAVGSGVPAAVPSGVPGGIPVGVDTTQPSTGSTGGNDPTTTASSQGFPWLVLLVIVIMLALIILALFMVRQRRTVTASPGGGARLVPASRPAPATTTTATTTTSTMAAAPVVAAAVPGASTAAAPATAVTCPNCGTANEWNENFCHECGQDLRPVKASLTAAAAPVADVVTDDMPYMETLDRTDEQLEYVLSRERILIGTAAGNDIVIDSSFAGLESVSPQHAELRREADGFFLRDINSENGTFVNDVRAGENLLAEGDVIRLGSVRFVYRVPTAS